MMRLEVLQLGLIVLEEFPCNGKAPVMWNRAEGEEPA
jgi:hypothetical protein